MKRFFALNNGCLLIKGAKRGAIYDLQSGNIFSVNSDSMKIIELLELNKPVEIVSVETKTPLTEIFDYLTKLEKFNLGLFVTKNFERSKIKLKQADQGLKFFHLELTEKCNLKCKHCYVEGQPKKDQGKLLDFTDYVKIIREARDLGSKKFQFIGGEPFLRRELIFNLVPEAKRIGYEFIEIFSNGTLITDVELKMVKDNNLCLAFSLHGSKPEIHDKITQKRGSWDKTVSVIKKAQTMGIPTRVAMVVIKYNESDVEPTIEFVKNHLGVKNMKIDYVRPSGRGCGADLSSKNICEKQRFHKPIFSKISADFFAKMKFGNNCFFDKICISPEGKVYPCIMERGESYGNVKKQKLSEILKSATAKKFRYLSKDTMEVCCDCEYRYGCFDCRVKARGLEQKDFYVKPWWCAYDPYTGEWGPSEKGGNHEKA